MCVYPLPIGATAEVSLSKFSEGFQVDQLVRIIAEPLDGPYKITEKDSETLKYKLNKSGKQWYHERELELAK